MPANLLSLPQEPLHDIAYLLCASEPLGPPAEHLPLLLTCRGLYHALTVPGPAAPTHRLLSPALQARIFRLKFDSAAVHRRLFPPRPSDLADQLFIACRLLRFLRAFATGRATCGLDCDDDDDEDNYEMAENHLSTALLMMLDNDGKNYAQLIHAGLPRFLAHYLQYHLWPDTPTTENDGWPADTPRNAAALWLSWLTTTRTALLAESPRAREDAVSAVLPFAVLPQRYPAAYAPPNHFSLPLHASDPACPVPITLPLPSSPASVPARYPHYPPIHARPPAQPHFGTALRLTLPPASIPAKLLFVARRELHPAMIPPHLPPGPGGPGQGLTQADYHALNRAKAAVLPRGACWDWEAGVAREVNARVDAGADSEGEEQRERRVIADGDEESRRWDDTFWKMRLCGEWIVSGKEEEEMFRPGEVYTPGSMSGLWQGKIYIPQGAEFNHVLQHPQYPSILSAEAHVQLQALGPGPGPAAANVPPAQAAPTPTPIPASAPLQRQRRGHIHGDEPAHGTNPQLFSQSSLFLVMQPLFLEMAEHHRVCLCAGEGEGEDVREREHERERDEDKEKMVPPPPLRARPRQVQVQCPPAPPRASVKAEAKACGVVPPPKPVMVRLRREARAAWLSDADGAGSGSGSEASSPAASEEEEEELALYVDEEIEALDDEEPEEEEEQEGEEQEEEEEGQGQHAAGVQEQSNGVNIQLTQDYQIAQNQNGNQNQDENQGQTPNPNPQQQGQNAQQQQQQQHNAQQPPPPQTQGQHGQGDGQGQGPGQEQEDERIHTYPALVDLGMTNAWFEGAPGSVVVLPRAAPASSASASSSSASPSLAKRKRDEVLVTTGFARPDVRVKSGCVGGAGGVGGEEQTATAKTYVYETYDPTRASSHDVHLSSSSASRSRSGEHSADTPNPDCATCARLSRARQAQREREAEEARRVLEREMRRFAGAEENTDTQMDVDMDMDMEDVDMDQFARGFMRSFADAAREYPCADADVGVGFAQPELDPAELVRFAKHTCVPGWEHRVRVRGAEADSDEEEEEEDAGGRKHGKGAYGGGGWVLGDDHPRGVDGWVTFECVGAEHASSSSSSSEAGTGAGAGAYTRTPYHPHPHIMILTPPIRREFERVRIGTACTGVRDTLVTGSLPSSSSSSSTSHTHFQSALYHDVAIYGRVRRWDGLVGMVRASRAGGGVQGAMTYLFVCGYVLGGGSFVGEWRLAAADPLRPSWGGAVVMSKVET